LKIKDFIRKVALNLPFAISKNIAIDQATIKLFSKILKPNSNCIDVGCHKGEIMDIMLKYAPQGKHLAFEPIPFLNEKLKSKYQSKISIYDCALSDFEGNSTFNLVNSNPAYSGLIKRKYDKEESDSQIHVKVKKLDNIINPSQKIDLIKIDTEGAEYGVLMGAKETIKHNKPIIIFEFGLGASDFYNTTAEMMFDFFDELNMGIITIEKNMNLDEFLSKSEFAKIYADNTHYLFLALARK
jgi:FkbM family methyltransferase